MSRKKSAKDKASERPKMLYEVLTEEYKRLGIFTPVEAEKILDKVKEEDFYSPGIDDERRQLGNDMLAEVRHKIHEKVALYEKSEEEYQKNKKESEKNEIENEKSKTERGAPFSALCFSGGGIRSATFNLGILQGLAKHNLLDKFHYLSTVSGGGYIGSWLSAWIYRERVRAEAEAEEKRAEAIRLGEVPENTPENTEILSAQYVRKVQAELAPQRHKRCLTPEEKEKTKDEHEVEPMEITHLRSYSNYMSPRPGLFSTDTWTLIVVYLRNLLLNWTVFVPILAAFLLLPRIYYGLITENEKAATTYFYDFAFGEFVFFLISGIAGCLGFAGLVIMRPTLRKNFWSETDDKADVKRLELRIVSFCILLIMILAFGLTVFWTWFQKDINGVDNIPSILYFIAFGAALPFVGGILAAIFATFLKIKDPPFEKEDKKTFFWFREAFTSLFSGAVGGALLYLVVYLLEKNVTDEKFLSLILACFGAPLYLLVFLISVAVFVGIASKITDDMDREWLSRFGALLLILAVVWAVMSSVVLYGQLLFEKELFNQTPFAKYSAAIISSVGGISGLITLILGFSRKNEAKNDKEPKSKTGFLLWFAPQIAAPIFALFLMIMISFGTFSLILLIGEIPFVEKQSYLSWVMLPTVESKGQQMLLPAVEGKEKKPIMFQYFYASLFWFGILALVGVLMGFVININRFSLHATYRERLIRSYLGASRADERLKTANSFTGLDDEDNLEMKDLLHRPFHIVNMTLNLSRTENLRWQNRKAESFTASALHCGSSNMDEGIGSYRDSHIYNYSDQNGRSLTLGTAAAISGAAASPNMGYYTSSKAVSFLMALFNVRLGWWLGNPGTTGEKSYRLPAPNWSPKVFFAEALGLTDDRHKWVYLSDGGHFDNLGLYEMVLRRVHLIVVCDSGADGDFSFNDFGTAIHKIRVDMGIPIEFKDKSETPSMGRNCAIATIKYKEVDGRDAVNGTLIYIKPTLDGDEAIDLINYKKSNDAFPHESTADQMYSETQFESYRKLGTHMINSFCCEDEKNTPCGICSQLSQLVEHAREYLDKFAGHGEPASRKKK